ncbi:MAG: T9SS type A sorting domain-containing protein [Flavobacteriales bacterium]|nr:T9SS type A sorting domain-containing protein [Flavobacteriales bacterium]
MKHQFALFALCGTLLTTGQHATAQVFIPDTLVRNWLNGSIPGIVDVNGIMDTSHVGIATLDSVTWMSPYLDTAVVDLTGLAYLDALEYCHVLPYGSTWSQIDVVCPALPPILDEFEIYVVMGARNISLPDLRAPLRKVQIVSANIGHPIDLNIASIQDTVHHAVFARVRSVSCSANSGYFDELEFYPSGHSLSDTFNFVLPGWRCGEMWFHGVDLGACNLDLVGSSCDYFRTYGGIPRIDSWPDSVRTTYMLNLQLEHMAPWPVTIEYINMDVDPQLCLPMFPNTVRDVIAYSRQCIPNIPDSIVSLQGQFITGGDTVLCTVLNTNCSGTAAAIAGRHVIDSNANGLIDPGEPIFPWGQVAIQPMNALVPGGSDGWWERGAFPGTYTITSTSNYPYLINTAPAQHTATFGALGEVDSTNHFAYTLLPGVNDLRVDIGANVARPGFDNIVHLAYENYGTTTLSADLQLTFDTDQSWVGSTPAPTTQSANTANWILPNLPPGTQGQIAITVHTDAAVPIGTALLHTALIDPLAGDTTPANNTANWVDTVIGAYDPNDKLLDTPTATLPQVQADELDLTYTIRFQNTGTFQAERVVIVDTLSHQLQWSTFQFLGSSHACDWYMVDGVLHFIFDPILLPDSGSNEAASHGFVRFSMRPSTQLQLGETVSNIAHIVFDLNAAIVTPPAVFLVDNSTSVRSHSNTELIVMPNPTRDRLRVDGFSGTVRYRIRDIGGRLTQRGTLNGPGTIEVATLSPGTYFLEVEQNTATRTVRFFRER